MSEELIRKNLTKHGKKIGLYEYYPIGNTTLKDLKKFEIIPNKNYGEFENKKPDALLVDRRDRTDIKIILVQEDKNTKEFVTPKDKEKAVKQCVELYCKPLNARIEVVTDYNEWVWINPQVKNKNGYEYILTEDGYPIQTPLEFKTAQQINENLKLITKILESISEKNSVLKKEETQNPSILADRVWQTIWLASGEDPDMCLATFVEIFVFKYLSDLGILNINDDGVKVTFNEVMNKDSNSLKYYFRYVRPHIKKMFPINEEDGTSIINGTVLKPEIEEHNIIFHNILQEFDEYAREFGAFTNIDPQFKSRLYEKFLKKSLSQKNWGQYFTPRNIIKAMIQMSGIEKLPEGSKIYDPACGVGGFILEPLLANRQGDYYIDGNGNLQRKLTYLGHDRDPNTIILAKANMLIFISELLRENKAITKQFAKMFNETFSSLHKSVLGSLSDLHNDYYDLIMTNPPYVTSGSSTQKDVIKQDGKLSSFYKINATGIEGLFLEKIIRELKPNANALIIIPDGILNRLNDNKLRRFIKDTCIINAIISLPVNAFYTSVKKTYILSVTKKRELVPQKDPVFTYLIINIGETLDAKRFECENDLPKMVKQYNYFMVDKNNLESDDPQLKIQSIDKFDPNEHWSVDRWWSPEEKTKLGLKEEQELLTIDEFYEEVKDFKEIIDDAVKKLEGMKNEK